MLDDSVFSNLGSACEQHFAGVHLSRSLHGRRSDRERLMGAEQALLHDVLHYHLGIFCGGIEPITIDL